MGDFVHASGRGPTSRTFTNRNFVAVTSADFLARTAYQMAKTPLLPLFAAGLGAGDAFLGLIVSVSTFTGMVLKPFIGILSDRWGRRLWLIGGTVFFAGMPFVYQFVQTPGQLFAVRIVHGLATAIYGPVTLAYVTEITGARRAEGLGWFGLARSGGYIVGPALAGGLLLMLDPVTVFTIVGLLGCAVFVPILMLGEPEHPKGLVHNALTVQIRTGLAAGLKTPALWLAGGLEAVAYVGLYAMKAFLPVYALQLGINIGIVGLFLGLQEAVAALGKPIGGRIGDHLGYLPATGAGMAVTGGGLVLLAAHINSPLLLIVAVLLGCGQALIFPATTALVAQQVGAQHTGTGMGLLGTMQNGGKVVGPLVGGLLAQLFSYQTMFVMLGGMLLCAAVGLVSDGYRRRNILRRRPLSVSGHSPRRP